MNRIKVLIVDDSAIVRQKLEEILSGDPELEVIGTAQNPYIAVQKMEEIAPDVITLDIEMPGMDGLTFLQKIMEQHPLPVVICSSMADENSDNYLRALSLGAKEVIHKPKLGTRQFLEEAKITVRDVVKAAYRSKNVATPKPLMMPVEPKYSADAVMEKPKYSAQLETTEKILVIGASTGGTEALRYVLSSLPGDCPGIVVVQHMPELFTRSFAQSLNQLCRISVKEAETNDTVLRGQCLIAPGSRHMMLKRSGARYFVEILDGPLVNRHRPSVDVLFRSAARYAGPNAVGVIMTGMGDDGAKGLLEMREAGSYTIAQDEKTSVVFGMPKVAIELGAAIRVSPLEAIPADMLAAAKR